MICINGLTNELHVGVTRQVRQTASNFVALRLLIKLKVDIAHTSSVADKVYMFLNDVQKAMEIILDFVFYVVKRVVPLRYKIINLHEAFVHDYHNLHLDLINDEENVVFVFRDFVYFYEQVNFEVILSSNNR